MIVKLLFTTLYLNGVEFAISFADSDWVSNSCRLTEQVRPLCDIQDFLVSGCNKTVICRLMPS